MCINGTIAHRFKEIRPPEFELLQLILEALCRFGVQSSPVRTLVEQ